MTDRDKGAGSPQSKISIANAILDGTRLLLDEGVPEARREAGSLLAHALGQDRTFVISHADDLIDPVTLKSFALFVQRRAQGEPLQYITGRQEFFGLTFQITPDVLIPRPETELLVEAALPLLDSNTDISALVCDLGTGSGCITVALLQARPHVRAIATDISEAAIRVAQNNAVAHHVRERVSFVVSNCFAALSETTPLFDLVVSNPPYVSAKAVPGLQREVRDYEPLIALTPGADGLVIIRRLLDETAPYLRHGGYLIFEIGFDQGAIVEEMINRSAWRLLAIHPDLQGIPRIVALQKASA